MSGNAVGRALEDEYLERNQPPVLGSQFSVASSEGVNIEDSFLDFFSLGTR